MSYAKVKTYFFGEFIPTHFSLVMNEPVMLLKDLGNGLAWYVGSDSIPEHKHDKIRNTYLISSKNVALLQIEASA